MVLAVLVLAAQASAEASSCRMQAHKPTYVLAPGAVSTQENAVLDRVEDHLRGSITGLSHLDYLSLAGVCAKKRGQPYRCPMKVDVTTYLDSRFSHTVCELGVSATRRSAWLSSTTCPAEWLNT
jgi:hypothetical protein